MGLWLFDPVIGQPQARLGMGFTDDLNSYPWFPEPWWRMGSRSRHDGVWGEADWYIGFSHNEGEMGWEKQEGCVSLSPDRAGPSKQREQG